MARRTKLNAEVQRRILQAIQAGATYEYAAQFGGVTRVTLFYWLRKGEQQNKGIYRTFFNEFKRAESMACVGSLAVINKEAREGNWQAAAWLLERRFGYTREGPPPVQITIETEGLDMKTLINEYNTGMKAMIGGPVIDLDEE
jgi:hypothetical protein